MSFEKSEPYLQSIVDGFDGDRFAACVYVYTEARRLNATVDDALTESESIHWAITGQAPDDLESRIKQHMNLKLNKTAYMDELMEYVVDEEIEDAVRQSFDTSIRLGSLTFLYGDIREQERKVRVRILTRMCWDKKNTVPKINRD